MLPALQGRPIRVIVRRSLGPNLAATSIPSRTIFLDRQVLQSSGDFERILVHELFHFVWVRLSNATRLEWGAVLGSEFAVGALGELGWSAEWRKGELILADCRNRTRAWRRYACESFCDTAAWRFSGLRAHEEFTLEARFRPARREWFQQRIERSAVTV